jgi:prepilin-type N-terminal cleavage/methylation domain-containing protein
MKPLSKPSVVGYTIIELLVVMVIIAILSAIVAPSWLAFLNRQRLGTAQSQVLTVIRDAQVNARRDKRNWEVCFREDPLSGGTTVVQYSVHPIPAGAAADCAGASWQKLIGEADKIGIMPQGGTLPYKIQFDYSGLVRTAPQCSAGPNCTRLPTPPTLPDGSQEIGRITFASKNRNTLNTGGSKRCIYVSTMIGAIRTAQDNDCVN